MSSLPIVFLILLVVIAIAIRIFRESLTRFLCRHRPVISDINFPNNQIVISANPIRRTILLRAVLYVPQGTNAVMALPPTGNPDVFQEGEQIIRYSTTFAFIKYVDIRRRTNNFLVENTFTKDGFQISIGGRISWRVIDVVAVTEMIDPIQEILNEVENAIRSISTEYEHDLLISTPDQVPTNIIDLIDAISEYLNERTLFVEVIELETMVLDSRIADPRRTATPEPTEAELNAQAIKVTLENRKEMLDVEEIISKYEMKIQEERAKIEYQIRKKDNDLAVMREQARIELERQRVLAHERVTTLTPVLQIFAHILSSPGYDRMIDSWSMNRLSRTLENIVGNLWDDPEMLTAEYRTGPRPAENAREKLTYQLVDLWDLEDYVEHKLVEEATGELNIVIKLKTKFAVLNYDISKVDPVLTKIGLINSKGDKYPIPKPELYSGLTIVEIIKKLEEKYGPGKKQLPGGLDWV